MDIADDPDELSAEDFVGILSGLFGPYGWRAAFQAGTGYSRTQIHRYESGRDRIPKRVSIILQMAASMRNNGIPLPSDFNQGLRKSRRIKTVRRRGLDDG